MTRWAPTGALLSAAAAGGGLLLLAVTLHRPDLVVFAAPLVVGLALWLRPARPAPTVRLRAGARTLREGESILAQAEVREAAAAELVVAELTPGRLLRVSEPPAVAAAGASRLLLSRVVTAQRWGRSRVGTVTVTALAAQGLLRAQATARAGTVRVMPLREQFSASDAVPRAVGTIGAHRSRAPGEGSELSGVRLFQPGDRLRRINWPMSLRSGSLHVTATQSDRDTAIMLVLDTAVDIPGPDAGGSLDVAVHAAAAIAEHYLRAGDRVGLLDQAQPFRPLRPRAGRPQLDRIADALLDVEVSTPTAIEEIHTPRVLTRLAPHALVLLFSPLLGAARPERAIEIAQSGRLIVVVDTLGAAAPAADPGPLTDLAWRLQLLQREHDVDRLADLGVPVVPWRGGGSLDEVLRSLSRASAAPRRRA